MTGKEVPTPDVPILRHLTYTEAHAALLGLVGLLAGVGWAAGMHQLVAGLVVPLFGIVFGLRAAPDSVPVAARVARREPWYFTGIFVVTAIVGIYGARVPL